VIADLFIPQIGNLAQHHEQRTVVMFRPLEVNQEIALALGTS
jgi:hypothetical protein